MTHSRCACGTTMPLFQGTYTDNFSNNFTSNFGGSSYEGANGDDNNNNNNSAFMSSSGMQAYGDDSPLNTDNNGDAFQGMPEPEALADNALNKFTAEWEGTLKEKAKLEDAKKKQALEAARADHEKFVSERQTRRDTRMSSNRTQEQVFLEQLEADLESDNPWERIVSLVDTQFLSYPVLCFNSDNNTADMHAFLIHALLY
eukprot:2571-Heterococcus_DN1.PRE.2